MLLPLYICHSSRRYVKDNIGIVFVSFALIV